MTFFATDVLMDSLEVRMVCERCIKYFGTVRLNIAATAIAYRGPLLCPNCRETKCDNCGYFLNESKPRPVYVGSFFLGNLCEHCEGVEVGPSLGKDGRFEYFTVCLGNSPYETF